MQSSPTFDAPRFVRALSDPWSLGVAGVAGVAVVLFGFGPVGGTAAVLAVMGVRMISEFVIPRSGTLALHDAVVSQSALIRASLASLGTEIHNRVPADIEHQVAKIRRVIEDILARRTETSVHSREVFTVLRTATDYLPAALRAYMRLPADYATSRRIDGRRTPLDVLREQLQLLETETTGIADAISRDDLDRLLAHGRFLAERFQRSELDLGAGDP